ncbi:MAG: M20 family metallopeptidase [Anaerolineales bacterium]|nr:M20 family metallopeptidase [Anaerolineales bacterium]
MLARANQIHAQLSEWRRDIHRQPDLGFQEQRTAQRVVEVLAPLGYRIRSGVGRTGVIAELGAGSPVVAIRADMDALPILEANETDYASQTPGVMHACGHDAHTAMALGVATLLAGEQFPGTLRLIFQPAEEVADEEGVSGAPRMVQEGAAQDVAIALALHVDASLPVGDISVDAGPSSAGVDTFYATIIGEGGHGASPHKVIDPIHIAGHVILALNGIVSRRLHPFAPAVVSIGSIHGGDASNVIPEEVCLTGTIRFMTAEVQKQIHAEIERTLHIARAMGGDFKLEMEIGYPPMYNHPEAAALIRQVAIDLLGADHLQPPKEEMGAEDFGFFSQVAPGAMFSLGCLIEGDERKHHHPRFDIDERCLPIGSALLAEAALRYLRSCSPR